jgi:hypothetical protein
MDSPEEKKPDKKYLVTFYTNCDHTTSKQLIAFGGYEGRAAMRALKFYVHNSGKDVFCPFYFLVDSIKETDLDKVPEEIDIEEKTPDPMEPYDIMKKHKKGY